MGKTMKTEDGERRASLGMSNYQHSKKIKAFHYSIPSGGPAELIPVYRQSARRWP